MLTRNRSSKASTLRTHRLALAALVLTGALICSDGIAQPTLVSNNLAVRTAAEGLVTPVSMAFLGPDDFFVVEKNTGQVKRVTGGATNVVLDLAVNFASERGLLGIALHPDFPADPGVYLYWTESSSGMDTGVIGETSLLGNRVDRFVWDGSVLTFDESIIQIRAIQQDAGEPERGNHDGGVIRFGPDGKLYVIVGDVGRRGQLQNLVDGPFGPGEPDDAFGGPEPDDAHRTGVILRLNDDGSTPLDNPFYDAGAAMGGEVGANVQRIFAYGFRNSFGLAFDPVSGDLWMQENGDDSFDEINRVTPGMNSGWIQFMGPAERIHQFKEIETSAEFSGLQQIRWPPDRIADTPEEAMARLFVIPGSEYSDPEFSWKFAVAPGGIGFLNSSALGPQYDGNLFVGASRPFLEEGYLFRFRLTGNRRQLATDGPGLADRVADNAAKFDITESEDLLFGSGFGIGTDIQTGPSGNLFVVSLSNGAVYEIFATRGVGRGMRPIEDQAAPAELQLWVRGAVQSGGSVSISYSLPAAADASVSVFDVRGRQVARLASGSHAAGVHEATWSGSSRAGVYFIRLRADASQRVERVVVLP